MKKRITVSSSLLVIFILGGCSTYFYDPTDSELHTNYQPGAVYILQQDIFLHSNKELWTTYKRPRYWASERRNTYSRTLPKGSRIQFKKIVHKYYMKMGHTYYPVGIILDEPFEGKIVSFRHISLRTEHEPPTDSSYGKYINPEYLVLDTEK